MIIRLLPITINFHTKTFCPDEHGQGLADTIYLKNVQVGHVLLK